MDDASAPVLFSAKTKKNVPPIKQKSDRPREYLRPDEVEVLIKAARKVGRHGHRDAAMILLMYRHGLRTAELISLKWSQVDLKHGYLDVKRVKNGHDSIHPLRSTELRALRQVKRDYPENPYVFISERQAPISSRSVRAIVARAGEEADFPFTLHPHQLRHSCGYYLASQGHDTRSIQDYLGHKNIHHTVRYTKLSPDRFKSFWGD